MDIKQQFCKRGHDTNIVGRNTSNACRACTRLSDNTRYRKNIRNTKIRKKKYNKIYFKNNKFIYKNGQWKSQGIFNFDGTQFTTINFDRLYQIQQGRCGICNKHSTDLKRQLDVDHNHKTGIVRGLLCRYCNVGIGIYEKRKKEFKNYLKKYIQDS